MTSRVKLEDIAARLLQDVGLDRAPIDVEAVARMLRYRVIRQYFGDPSLSGSVMRAEDRVVTIGINTLHAPVRQRFSIAHEIGHAQLHLGNGPAVIVDPPARNIFNRDERASLGLDEKEIEANQFAAALLMPRELVRSVGLQLVEKSPTLTIDALIDRLADRFDVSTQAMRYRLVNLGILEP